MSVIINGSNTPTAGGVTYGDGTQYATTAAGSAGGVLYSAGSSAPAFTGAGTSGQVLTSAGAGAPTWTTLTSGGLTLLTTVTPTGVGTFAATSLTSSKEIIIVIDSIVLDGAAFLNFALSANNGSSYGSDVRFTTSGVVPIGQAQIYRTGTSGITKPYYSIYTASFLNGSDATTGVVNAIRISTSTGNLFTGGSVLFYGMN